INEKYQETLFLITELTNRLNANKRSEVVMGAIIKGIVLGVEEHIRDWLKSENIEKKDFFKCIKRFKVSSHQFEPYYKMIQPNISNNDFFVQMKKLCEENDSLEKYLMIYYHSRNYLAHNNINMFEFFVIENDTRLIAILLDAITIIIYLLGEKYLNMTKEDN
ncbi:MAG: hypothetical protein Q7S59_02215, partial [Sulfurimonas sp.]|nr:hypothetical protein [Sulfurimonas sp.]